MRSEVPTGSLPIKEGGHFLDVHLLRPAPFVPAGPSLRVSKGRHSLPRQCGVARASHVLSAATLSGSTIYRRILASTRGFTNGAASQ